MTAPSRAAKPRYLKLAAQLRREVATGKWRPGDRLPSCAVMKAQHGVSQNTWDKAYSLLEREGLVKREPNRGVFVANPDARRTVGVIGVATGEAPWQHPYYAQLLKGIHNAAHLASMDVLHLIAGAAIKWEKVDGVLTFGDASVGKVIPGLARVSLLASKAKADIVTDDAAGVVLQVRHLLELGHRRIAYLAMELPEFADVDYSPRVKAYLATLRSAGIEPDMRWIRSLRGLAGPMRGFDVLGREKMGQWLREDWKGLGCTGLICQNDETAVAAIDAMREAGLRVPEDISVVGFDGVEIGSYFRPRLTTIAVPLEAIGEAGVELLLRKIRRPLLSDTAGAEAEAEAPTSTVVMPVALSPGESTGPPALKRQ